jgi:glycosyltransferase involved in cell wall biosynthesis
MMRQHSTDNLITNLMLMIWKGRPDLQRACNIHVPQGAIDFVRWCRESATREYGLIESDFFSSGAESTLAPRPLSGKVGTNLIGYVHAELGMGEHVRMSAAAFSKVGTDFCVVNFNHGVASRQDAKLEHGKVDDHAHYRTNIFHVNADQMLLSYAKLGHNFFANRYNIGYWAWELSKCPEEWYEVVDLVDEIWAPSKFIQSAFAEITGKPVIYMPLCVSLPTNKKDYFRKDFGLSDGVYLFLYTFDFFSYMDRKNPFAAIRAFKVGFPHGSEPVALVLKVMNGVDSDPRWIEMLELIGGDQRIIIINKTLDRDALLGLFSVCDAYVSLHRSEGFGRGPAEAMYLGKPVIVTNYSGNTDFTLLDNSCLVDYRLIPVEVEQYVFEKGQVWADPNIEHAAWFMQKLFNDRGYADRVGQAGQLYVKKNFNPSVVGDMYHTRLENIGLL